MNRKLLLLTCIVLFSNAIVFSQTKPSASDQKMKTFIDGLMKKMTIDEKIGQLNLAGAGDIITGQTSSSDIGRKIKEGNIGAILNLRTVEKIRDVQKVAIEESRLKIPLIFGLDVIHGYRTTFPIPLALASSFDMSLIEKSARIAAIEASADGLCWTFSPMVDITRDPRWSRIAEGAGEDTYLGSQVARAMVKGYQGDDLTKNNTIMACVKHFAMYGAAEAGREYNTTDMSRLRMYNEYLPPYKAAFDAGAGSAMSSFNEIDGIPASGNKWLMTDLLRKQWGFKGFVVSDFTAINEMTHHGMGDLQTVSALAIKAGTDMDMVGEAYLSTLKKSLKEGKITESYINQSCRRILEAKYRLGLFDDPFRYCNPERAKTEIGTEEHMKTAREIATQTFVLLKNENQLLPLQKKGKIALIGPLADRRYDMAGMWSVAVDHSQSITVLKGFKDAIGDQAEIVYAKGSNIVDDPKLDLYYRNSMVSSIDPTHSPQELRDEAVALASKCDVIVAVMGEAAEMSGECASRSDISLPGSQQELLEALLKTGKPVVLVLFTGRPLILNWEQQNIPAILNVWFGGSQAGNAIADVVFGKVNPSGKLPVTFPQNVGQIPLYYNHKNTGRPLPEGEWFTKYLSNYLDVSNDPLYPFGYGLSYTTFKYFDLKLDKQKMPANGSINISVTLSNTGKYDGAEVAQLYIRDLVGSITRPVKELKGFQKVFLKAGESRILNFTLTPADLAFYNSELQFKAEPGDFKVFVGTNSASGLEASFELTK
ncbi:MAG: beta-glucosidase BglX [Lentimicrobiaceae bacterium]|jgi:beta-glucosidase